MLSWWIFRWYLCSYDRANDALGLELQALRHCRVDQAPRQLSHILDVGWLESWVQYVWNTAPQLFHPTTQRVESRLSYVSNKHEYYLKSDESISVLKHLDSMKVLDVTFDTKLKFQYHIKEKVMNVIHLWVLYIQILSICWVWYFSYVILDSRL